MLIILVSSEIEGNKHFKLEYYKVTVNRTAWGNVPLSTSLPQARESSVSG